MDNSVNNFLSRLFRVCQNPDVIDLAIGQPNFSPPNAVLEALKNNVGSYTRYTDMEGLPELRGLIQKKLINENKIKTENVIVTNGAIEAIFDTMLTYLSKDSEVILLTPCYGKYHAVPNLLGSKIKTVSLNNKNRPDFDKLAQCITKKTKLIVVNSPCNPTGVVYSNYEIKQLIKIAEEHDLILLSDEVYEKYVYVNNGHVSPARFSDRVITVNSFSKTYGLPGLRLGYLAGALDLVSPIRNVHMSNTTCSSYASQMAALAALNLKKDFFDLSSFNRRRSIVLDILDNNDIDYIFPEGTFYVYVYVNQDSILFAQHLLDRKLLVMPGRVFGSDHNAIRISYAIDEELLVKGLEILTNYLD